MKHLLPLTVSIVVAVIAGTITASAGTQVSPSQLPEAAAKFINSHYAGIGITECERDGIVYEVDLANGIDMEFGMSGDLVKIDGGRHLVGLSILKAILPVKAYNDLSTRKVIDKVEEVKFTRHGIKVELRHTDMDEYYYSPDGELLHIGE